MRDVKIKEIKRKTTLSKAAIRRAAEIAYGLRPSTVKSKKVKTKKPNETETT